MIEPQLLRIGELAARSGVSAGTIKHYLREGLLPEPVKTSRNMAYYPLDFVERIRLIKQLQSERFMPLRVIKELLERGPDHARALAELESRMLEEVLQTEHERTSRAQLKSRYDIGDEVLDRLAEIGVIEPTPEGYSASDIKIVEAICRFRARGFDERYGFNIYDTLRYRRVLEGLVTEEVELLTSRLTGKMDPQRAARLITDGAEPLHQLISALHSKLLVAELRRSSDWHG